jgi:hypothetical protein
MLNDVINEAVNKQQPPSDKGKRLRIYYGTQASVAPPTFVLFVNDKDLFHFSYKRFIENQIREIEASPANVEYREEKTLTGFNKTVDKLFKGFNPYFRHRFVVDFGTDDIKDYYVVRVNYSDEYLTIVFRDSEEFFTPKYLSKNKHFDTVKVYLLSPLGEKKTTIEFRNVNLETFQQDALSYTRDEDEILTTDVVFKYDVVVYE